jgi:hypothetical protein
VAEKLPSFGSEAIADRAHTHGFRAILLKVQKLTD